MYKNVRIRDDTPLLIQNLFVTETFVNFFDKA